MNLGISMYPQLQKPFHIVPLPVPERVCHFAFNAIADGIRICIFGASNAQKTIYFFTSTVFYSEFGVQGCIKATNQTNSKKKNGLDCKDSCYILQDDQLCPLFTVHEIMTVAADLKLGPTVSKESKQYLVGRIMIFYVTKWIIRVFLPMFYNNDDVLQIEGILTTIGLTKTRETRCGRLSGGQKKRLSIALELIDNPPVMFLDEPTT